MTSQKIKGILLINGGELVVEKIAYMGMVCICMYLLFMFDQGEDFGFLNEQSR